MQLGLRIANGRLTRQGGPAGDFSLGIELVFDNLADALRSRILARHLDERLLEFVDVDLIQNDRQIFRVIIARPRRTNRFVDDLVHFLQHVSRVTLFLKLLVGGLDVVVAISIASVGTDLSHRARPSPTCKMSKRSPEPVRAQFGRKQRRSDGTCCWLRQLKCQAIGDHKG